jgi:hypothetical protein
MDDFVAGFDGKEAIGISYEFIVLMKNTKLPMAKWVTSCVELNKI